MSWRRETYLYSTNMRYWLRCSENLENGLRGPLCLLRSWRGIALSVFCSVMLVFVTVSNKQNAQYLVNWIPAAWSDARTRLINVLFSRSATMFYWGVCAVVGSRAVDLWLNFLRSALDRNSLALSHLISDIGLPNCLSIFCCFGYVSRSFGAFAH